MNKKQERLRLLEVQIERLQRRIQVLEPRSNRYSWIRVFLFFGGLGLSLFVLIANFWWLALILAVETLLAFGILAHFHQKVDQSIAFHTLLRYIKQAHVARIKLDWENIPLAYTGERLEGHPFEYDLDITGDHSIHRLLNTAISREGSTRLRDWLLQTHPQLEQIQYRQALIRELTPLSRFRDRLTLASLIASRRGTQELEGQRLLSWLEREASSKRQQLLFWISCAFNLAIFVTLAIYLLGGPFLVGLAILASLIWFMSTAKQRGEIFEDANYLRSSLATLSSIFSYLEHYRYGKNLRLKELCRPFYEDRHNSPTQILHKTAKIASAATLRRNPFFWLPINVLFPWDAYCAYRLSQYKQHVARKLPRWLDTWFELEALCSLATFAYLNPEYVLPEVSQQAEASQPLFSGSDLGHPLIPVDKKVTNSFEVDHLGEVLIITGSNMAGKSTFLRTLGVNMVLAYAGGPVNASRLQTQIFRLFSCIRVTDSVTDGYSYFYAEVRRLRALLDALEESHQPPLFFLIDEIFKGTNNRERLIGSRSFVRAMVGRNCVGAISTHDLELVKMADQLSQVLNYHFREEVVDGRLAFDYILRQGPCPTTNALKIMRMEGLPVEEPSLS